MAVKCGRCKGHHATLQEVRECYNRPLPERSKPPVRTEPKATRKQVAFVRSLLDRLGRSEDSLPKDPEDYGLREVSDLINTLQSELASRPATPPAESYHPRVSEDGMYRMDGTIYKVQRAVHGSGERYAKVLVVVQDAERDEAGEIVTPAKVRFDYAPGIISRLTEADRLSYEEAKKFGALYGTCVRCGRTLTQEQSIDRMMGPVCFGKEYDDNYTQEVSV